MSIRKARRPKPLLAKTYQILPPQNKYPRTLPGDLNSNVRTFDLVHLSVVEVSVSKYIKYATSPPAVTSKMHEKC